MPQKNSKQKYFPLKPKTEEGFKDPVSWLGGRELVASLKGMLIYSIYGENIDPRPWMKSNPYPVAAESVETENDETKSVETIDQAWMKSDADYWNWKRTRFEFWEEYLKDKSQPNADENGEIKEFWFDYIADTGDGQRGVYGVGCLCLSDLWLAEDKTGANVSFSVGDAANETLLPRGSFLFIGGDTAYHVADYSSLHERFQMPFRWAFASVREHMIEHYRLKNNAEKYFLYDLETVPVRTDGKFDENWDGTLSKVNSGDPNEFWDTEPLRPLFGVPANHDYYDDLDGFNRQFRRPPFETVEENRIDPKYTGLPLKIPTFRREQEASYTFLRLPFDWYFLGIDSENEKLDFRQKVFFKELLEKLKPKKIIVSTPEPTTVFGKECDENDKTAIYVSTITESIGLKQPFFEDGDFVPIKNGKIERGEYCRLDLSGDVHHYARYWGPENKIDGQKEHSSDHYASLVAGGGGAFFDSTGTLIGKSKVTKNGKRTEADGKIPPQSVFPDKDCSVRASADRIFDLWNIRKGGYVQIAGAIIAVVIYYSLTTEYIYEFFRRLRHLRIGDDNFDGITAAIVVFTSLIFFAASGMLLHNLNIRLKVERAGDSGKKEDVRDNGKIKQLRATFFCFLAGAIVYVGAVVCLFLFFPPGRQSGGIFLSTVQPYMRSFLLLLNFAGVGLLVWLSIEYSNWLLQRFKFVHDSGRKPDSWLNLFYDAPGEENPDNRSNGGESLFGRIYESIRKQSVEYAPIFVLNIGAVAMLILAIYLFGDRPFSEIGLDLLFTVVALGGFIGIIFFAVSTGAHHQKGINRLGFVLIGLFHAILQLLTPFILIYYGDWRLVVAVILLGIFTNGVSGIHALLKFLSPDIDDKDGNNWKHSVWRLLTKRFGAWIMKRGNAWLLAAVWFVYGSIVLAAPFAFIKFAQPNVRSIDKTVYLLVEKYLPSTISWLPLVIVLLIAGYLGYRMSRVWFSWYLAVSLLFNGHNNEAGGAARIQGFKHILRIKVEKEKLTVYVIGFDDAEIELNKMRPRLVDKFELTPKSLG